MIDPAQALGSEHREALQEQDHPEWVSPMLATLAQEPFSREGWIFERKLDGERCLAFREGSRVRLLSRNRQDLNGSYPELVEAIGDQAEKDFVADGEVVAFRDGRTDFSRLQPRMQVDDPEEARRSGVAVYYYLFDLVHLNGFDLSRVPLRQRKSLLRRALDFGGRRLRYTPHRNRTGKDSHRRTCAKGWEGVIGKDAGSPYVHSRSRDWLKFKCVERQELVVGGYTEPEGSRTGLGALLLGYYEGDALVFAGKVGTGFDDATLDRLADRLSSLERDDAPFREGGGGADVHWVRPELVAEVGFTEWTRDGKLRHPRFLGLRRDKSPREVVRE